MAVVYHCIGRLRRNPLAQIYYTVGCTQSLHFPRHITENPYNTLNNLLIACWYLVKFFLFSLLLITCGLIIGKLGTNLFILTSFYVTCEPFTGPPHEYLEYYVFPHLLPSMEAMLTSAKKERCFERKRTKFNALDFLTESLYK